MILTLKRARTCALLTMVLGLAAALSAIYSKVGFLKEHTDFPAFYNAGRILNARGILYSVETQEHLYLDLIPSTPPHSREIRFYSYSPFFALFFAPLSRLPYYWAFGVWGFISLLLFSSAFWLTWTTADLPSKYHRDALMIALSFLPFYAWCVLGGQTSAFGLLSISLAIYFERKDKSLRSGVALSMLLYKPPLVLFFVPMLLITKRWRTLAGFSLGAVVLGMLSLSVIGLSGVAPYFRMLQTFTRLKVTGQRQTWLEIDLYSQLLFLPHAALMFSACLLISGYFLLRAWQKSEPWSITITTTIVLNLYVLLYDATIVIPAVVLTAGSLLCTYQYIPRGFRWLLVILFLSPWVEIVLVQSFGLQIVTFALITFGAYQIYLALKLPREAIV